MSQSLIEFIESLGYVLIAARDRTSPNAGWVHPDSMNARDGLVFMSRVHKSRKPTFTGHINAVRVDTLRLCHVLRPNRDVTLIVANCARKFGLPARGAALKIDVRWSEYTARDEELVRALVIPPNSRDPAIDMLIISNIECVM